MKIYLLTHLRETFKKSNTGQLVQSSLNDACHTIIWERKRPAPALLSLIENKAVALVYPATDNATVSCSQDYEYFIILDSTWQQAKKMMNKSPYLQNLPRIALSQVDSRYRLRRNQCKDGLCTAEVAINILRQKNKLQIADQLEEKFNVFNDQKP